MPGYAYRGDPQRVAFYQRTLAELGALPGVRAIGAIDDLPLTHDRDSGGLAVEGRTPTTVEKLPEAQERSVTPRLFSCDGHSSDRRTRLLRSRYRHIASSDFDQPEPGPACLSERKSRGEARHMGCARAGFRVDDGGGGNGRCARSWIGREARGRNLSALHAVDAAVHEPGDPHRGRSRCAGPARARHVPGAEQELAVERTAVDGRSAGAIHRQPPLPDAAAEPVRDDCPAAGGGRNLWRGFVPGGAANQRDRPADGAGRGTIALC